jgi:hypothetical protein
MILIIIIINITTTTTIIIIITLILIIATPARHSNAENNSVSDYIQIQTPLKGYYGLVRRECRTFMSGSVAVGFSFRAALAAESGSVNPVRN